MIKRIKKHADHRKSIHKREEIFSSVIPKVQLGGLPPISQPSEQSHRSTYGFLRRSLLLQTSAPVYIAQAGVFICNALPFILQRHPLLILPDPAAKGVLSKIL